MKYSLTLIVLLVCSIGFGQTKLIAWKSHSGSLHYFDMTIPDNLGNPPMRIEIIERLNDTTIVEHLGPEWFYEGRDTVINHPYCTPFPGLDSLKKYFPERTEFIGFDSVPDPVFSQPPFTGTDTSNAPVDVTPDDAQEVENEQEENSFIPTLPTQKPTSLLPQLGLTIGIFVLILGALIWYTARRRIFS